MFCYPFFFYAPSSSPIYTLSLHDALPIFNVLYATLMAIYLAQPVRNLYMQLTGSLPSEPVVLLIQTIFASILILIFGEIIPKAIFRAHADYVVKIIAIPIQILDRKSVV